MALGRITLMDYVHGKGRIKDVERPNWQDANFALPDVVTRKHFNKLREGDMVTFDLVLTSPRRATNVCKLDI